MQPKKDGAAPDAYPVIPLEFVDVDGNVRTLSRPIALHELQNGGLTVPTDDGKLVRVELDEGDGDAAGEEEYAAVFDWYDDDTAMRNAELQVQRAATGSPKKAEAGPPTSPKTPKKKNEASANTVQAWKAMCDARNETGAHEDERLARKKHNYNSLMCVKIDDNKKFAPLNLYHHSASSFRIPRETHPRIVVFGGTNGRSLENELYEFRISTATWRRLEGHNHIPLGRHSHTSVVHRSSDGSQHLIISGGIGLGGKPIDAESTRLSEQQSERYKMLFPAEALQLLRRRRTLVRGTAPLYDASQPHTARVLRHDVTNRNILQLIADSKKVTALEPADPSQIAGFLECPYSFDLSTGEWRRIVTDYEVPLVRHTSVCFQDMVVTYGGITDKLDVSGAVVFFNVGAQYAGAVPALYCHRILSGASAGAGPRYSHAVATYENKMIVYGGCDGNNQTLDDLWAFDVQKEIWERLPCAGTIQPRCGHTMVVVQNKLVVAGGLASISDLVPYRSALLMDLYPSAQQTFVWEEVSCDPPIPRLAFATAVACGDHASFMCFGGLLRRRAKSAPRVERSAKPAPTTSTRTSSAESSQAATPRKRGKEAMDASVASGGGTAATFTTAATNTCLLIQFPLRHFRTKSEEPEKKAEPVLSDKFKAFIKLTEQSEKKKAADITQTQRKITLEAREAAATPLTLSEGEAHEILDLMERCVELATDYSVSSIPQSVPEREARVTHIEAAISALKHARDVMKPILKGKPFRYVVIADLLKQAFLAQKAQQKLLPSLNTPNVTWNGKDGFTEFCTNTFESLKNLLTRIKEIKAKYIEYRVSELMKNVDRHKQVLIDLRKVVEKIQHDKIWMPKGRNRHSKKEDVSKPKESEAEVDQKKKLRKKAAAWRKAHKMVLAPPPKRECPDYAVAVSRSDIQFYQKTCTEAVDAAVDVLEYMGLAIPAAQRREKPRVPPSLSPPRTSNEVKATMEKSLHLLIADALRFMQAVNETVQSVGAKGAAEGKAWTLHYRDLAALNKCNSECSELQQASLKVRIPTNDPLAPTKDDTVCVKYVGDLVTMVRSVVQRLSNSFLAMRRSRSAKLSPEPTSQPQQHPTIRCRSAVANGRMEPPSAQQQPRLPATAPPPNQPPSQPQISTHTTNVGWQQPLCPTPMNYRDPLVVPLRPLQVSLLPPDKPMFVSTKQRATPPPTTAQFATPVPLGAPVPATAPLQSSAQIAPLGAPAPTTAPLPSNAQVTPLGAPAPAATPPLQSNAQIAPLGAPAPTTAPLPSNPQVTPLGAPAPAATPPLPSNAQAAPLGAPPAATAPLPLNGQIVPLGAPTPAATTPLQSNAQIAPLGAPAPTTAPLPSNAQVTSLGAPAPAATPPLQSNAQIAPLGAPAPTTAPLPSNPQVTPLGAPAPAATAPLPLNGQIVPLGAPTPAATAPLQPDAQVTTAPLQSIAPLGAPAPAATPPSNGQIFSLGAPSIAAVPPPSNASCDPLRTLEYAQQVLQDSTIEKYLRLINGEDYYRARDANMHRPTTVSVGVAAPAIATKHASKKPNFKGRLTPGERAILEMREKNSHW